MSDRVDDGFRFSLETQRNLQRVLAKVMILGVTVIIADALFSARAFAGAPTTAIVIDGPGISPRGIVVNGIWPGWLSFIDITRGTGVTTEPDKSLPRYTLTGYTKDNHMWYTVFYVWDPKSARAVVYLPGPSELGFRVNFQVTGGSGGLLSYEKLAGKWHYVLDEDWARKWADEIRKALPKAGPKDK